MDFNRAPLLVIWEATQACDLACIHCHTSGSTERHPEELTTTEGFHLLRNVKEFGNPLMVFTGGDPLKRPDLHELIRYSVSIGLRSNVTPSATPLLTPAAIEQLQACGISRLAMGLDGPNSAIHDGYRGTPGAYDRSMAVLRHAREIGLDTQVLTTVTRGNLNHLGEMAEQVAEVRSLMWSLCFESESQGLTAPEYERVFEFLYDITKVAPFEVKTTEAAHYRRYVARRWKLENAPEGTGGRGLLRTPGLSEGRGFLFISHTGEIYPGGNLRIAGGNVRRDSVVDVYRHSDLFLAVRDSSNREGKCGACEYCHLCGGSPSRAYALTGNYLAEDPRCSYEPQAIAAVAK